MSENTQNETNNEELKNQTDDNDAESVEEDNDESVEATASEENDNNGEEEESAPPVEVVTVKWKDLGLSDDSTQALIKSGFLHPTQVQVDALPQALAGKNLLVTSKTGTGKKGIFLLTMIEKLSGKTGTLGLVITPDAMTAVQAKTLLDSLARERGLTSLLITENGDIAVDEEGIKTNPNIIIATAKRAAELLEKDASWISAVEIAVVDELSTIVKAEGAEKLEAVLGKVNPKAQMMMFAIATNEKVTAVTEKWIKNPVNVLMGADIKPLVKTQQKLMFMQVSAKARELKKLVGETGGQMTVFVRSKDGAARLIQKLVAEGIDQATTLHHELMPEYREQTLKDFLGGKYKILITTDYATRAMSLGKVEHLVNYDLPGNEEEYVNRVKKTGVAELCGKTTSFITPYDENILGRIEIMVGDALPEEFCEGAFIQDNYIPRRRHGGHRGGGRGRFNRGGRSGGSGGRGGGRHGGHRSGGGGGRGRR